MREEVLTVIDEGGAISLELVPLREGVARAFLRQSPRSPKLSEESVRFLIKELEDRPYSRIIVQDTKKGLIRRIMKGSRWQTRRAIPTELGAKCSLVTTYDLPMRQDLMDSNGLKPDLNRTSTMSGIEVPVGDRKGWAFYTEEGDQARIVSEEERKQGLLVATQSDDLFVVADCLVRFLSASKKSWAVFSMDMGRFIRKFDPITMIRMTLDSPKGYEHSAVPITDMNKGELLGLFSEYYDESMLQARFRLRKFRADKNYSLFMVDGGFVINRLEGDTGLIYDIYVSPAHQKKGLGNELMKCALTDLNGRVSSCYLHTSYPRAKRLYEKFGFKAVYSQLGIRLDELALERPSAK
jgi:ribosomal protein S18 acetylase RimI-like enzyme